MKYKIYIFILLLSSNYLFGIEGESNPCPTLTVTGANVNCYGGTNGYVNVGITNGSGDYTITWSNGVHTNYNPGLAVGTYTVNVKDNVTGCTSNGAYVVSSPDPISVTNTITNVDCFGNSTGKVQLTVLGGSAPYAYNWQNSSGGSTLMSSKNLLNVGSGSYKVTITDNKSCTYTQNFTITQPVEALNSSNTNTNVSCYGGANGAINVEVWGGTPYYTYSWSNGTSTQDVSNLTNGSYSLLITDINGCSLNKLYTITQPAILGGTVSTTDVLCYGEASGSASFSVIGGTAPYNYAWQNTETLFSTNSNILSNIIADDYQLTITDANYCKNVVTMTVNQPSLLTSFINTYHNVSCYGGNDGSIDINVSGGTSPYSYNWKNEALTLISTLQDINNLVANTYSVTITDDNGCTKNVNQIITQPEAPITVTDVITDVLCYGMNTGAIDITVTGGTIPYSYSWASGQSTEDLSNLIAGNYNYSIIDFNNCSFSGVLTVDQPKFPIIVTNIITDANCYGDTNGIIDLTVTGGTLPYKYNWSNSQFLLSLTSQDLNGFVAESYRYEVTDFNGCKEIDTLTISQPAKLTNTLTGINILCKDGNNGSTNLSVFGGVKPYTYNWNNGFTSEDVNSLTDGTYTVVVTDNHGCTLVDSIGLTEPKDSLSFTFEVKDVLCNDGTNGEIDLTIAGGTTPYRYNWSNGGATSMIRNLVSDTYRFTITDFNNCLLIDSIYVNQPDPLTLNEIITPVTCNGLSDGAINVTPQGGTAPYQFTWYNSTFALSTQTEDLIHFPANIYQVEIIDSNKCFYEMYFEIKQPDSLLITYDSTKVSCFNGNDGSIYVTITGGNPTYTYKWSDGVNYEDRPNLSAKIYSLIVTDQKMCTDSIKVDIVQPDSIQMNFEYTEISCIDQHDGIATSNPYGGNGGYNYLWSNDATMQTNEGLYNQYYAVTVSDILGCLGRDSIFIPKNNKVCIESVINAFSPNKDNYNDTWFIENVYLYPNAEMKIYNRWGNLVNEQLGIYEPWDGKINGVDAPADTYYYIFNLNHPDREPVFGNITIIR
jgi:gliding motility-associated-like protein